MFQTTSIFVFVAFCSTTIVLLMAHDEPNKIVTLANGKIRGRQLKTLKNTSYFAFQEIPYAAPPIGNLRFKEATTPRNWKGILNTTKNTKICWQLRRNDSKETEDCLYLNVYTPVEPGKATNLLPVLFWLHGGFFLRRDGTFDSFGPQLFMEFPVVLVTINYRLGVLGFLSTGDHVISGNLGLKDQHFALKWVKKNIFLFGGDPSKITIGGQSAGAGGVGHFILNKRTAGLFRAAILQSGSPLSPKMFQKHPRYWAYELGKSLSKEFHNSNSTQDLLCLLQNVSAEDIKLHSDMPVPIELRNSIGNDQNFIWAPVMEADAETSFISGPMHEKLKRGDINFVPTLMGIASEEELANDLNELKPKAKSFDDDFSYLVNGNLNIKEENKIPAGKTLKAIYTDGLFSENFASFVKFISDAKYTTPVIRHADLQSKFTDVYFYQFSYEGILGNNNVTVQGADSVAHEEEIPYIFIRKDVNSNSNDYPCSDLLTRSRLLKLWTNFIIHLNPTPKKETLLNDIIWRKVTANSFWYLNINDTLRMKKDPKQYKKWRDTFDEFAEELQETY